jgi:tetratricopeptide (TPR) repeat protein
MNCKRRKPKVLLPGAAAALAVVALALGACPPWQAAWAAEKADAANKRQLSAADLNGHAVNVPQPDRASLLLFVMADQPQSQKALEQVAAAVGAKPAMQVVMVVSGQKAEAAAKSLDGKLPGPVVVDADYGLAGKMGVRAWPTTLIILSDGEELAHMAGLAKSFAKDLECYLDFTAGKIDRETLSRRLSASQVIEDDPHQMARRHLEVAERQLAKGLLEEARRELDRGLSLAPNDADLELANARLLLLEGKPDQATAALDRMDQASVPPWLVDTIRGRVLVALSQWDKAADVLARAIRLNPEPGEAYYALGLLHEHRGEWQAAAQAFRAAFESTPAGRAIRIPEPLPVSRPPVQPQEK